MEKIKKNIVTILVAIIALLGGATVTNVGGGSSINQKECVVSSVANVQVGHQESKTILSENTRRAWARISQVQGPAGFASTTPFLSFNEGAAATVNSGVTLGTSTPHIDFGLNTDFPYTGAVTGIIGNGGGTTTVQVTDCIY